MVLSAELFRVSIYIDRLTQHSRFAHSLTLSCLSSLFHPRVATSLHAVYGVKCYLAVVDDGRSRGDELHEQLLPLEVLLDLVEESLDLGRVVREPLDYGSIGCGRDEDVGFDGGLGDVVR